LGTAGCLSLPVSRDPDPNGTDAPPPPGGRRPAFDDVDLPVDRSELVRGAPKDGIPAIVDPAFARDWSGLDRSLGDSHLVVGVRRGDEARAYPLSVLSGHEVVNDDFGGPLLVTYCPLCASAVTAVRRVDGQPATFGVSGFLFRSDLVMYDRSSGSLWSQIMATAIRGPSTGDRLELVPSTLTTWGEWQAERPDTTVLLPPPESGTIEPTTDGFPAAGSPDSGHVGVISVARGFDDDRLPARAIVVGVATDEAAKAYPIDRVQEAGVVNDRVGELPIVVAPGAVPQAYDRRIDGTTLSFEPAGEGRMRGGGSTWSTTTGRALSGTYEGRHLARATGVTSTYWFAWLDFHPEATVYGGST
jgi:hypothetical protein